MLLCGYSGSIGLPFGVLTPDHSHPPHLYQSHANSQGDRFVRHHPAAKKNVTSIVEPTVTYSLSVI